MQKIEQGFIKIKKVLRIFGQIFRFLIKKNYLCKMLKVGTYSYK